MSAGGPAPAPAPARRAGAPTATEQTHAEEEELAARKGKFDLPPVVVSRIQAYVDEYKQMGGKETVNARVARLKNIQKQYYPNPMLRPGNLLVDVRHPGQEPTVDDYICSLYDILLLDPQNLLDVVPVCPHCESNKNVATRGFVHTEFNHTWKAIIGVDRVTILVARKCYCSRTMKQGRAGCGKSFQTDDPASLKLFPPDPASSLQDFVRFRTESPFAGVSRARVARTPIRSRTRRQCRRTYMLGRLLDVHTYDMFGFMWLSRSVSDLVETALSESMGIANVHRTLREQQYHRASRCIADYYEHRQRFKMMRQNYLPSGQGAPQPPPPDVRTLVIAASAAVLSDRVQRRGEARLPFLRAEMQAVTVERPAPVAVDETFFVGKKVKTIDINGLQTVVLTTTGEVAASGYVASAHTAWVIPLLHGVHNRPGSEITTLYTDNAPNGFAEFQSVVGDILLRQDLKHFDGRLLDCVRSSQMRDLALEFGRDLSACFWEYDENDVTRVEQKRKVPRTAAGFYKRPHAVTADF